jgi:hypothetical protein
MVWIVIIVVAVFAYLLFLRKSILKENEAYRIEFKDIFDAHKALNYPQLSEQQQFDILDNENQESVSSMTQYKFIPTGLLDHYINIEPDRYLKHLEACNLQEKMKFNPKELIDGFYIHKTHKRFKYLFVERGSIFCVKRFKSYNQLLRFLVYYKLKLYAPVRYKYLNKGYYSYKDF